MTLTRRDFLHTLALAGAAGMGLTGRTSSASLELEYDVPPIGNLSLLHFTDCHAQLLPIYYREPSHNIGLGKALGRPPHLVGKELLTHFGVTPATAEAHALTCIDFQVAASKYGTVGGFAHLATLIKRLRAERPHSLLLDGGDTWQGSATALWTQGQDMIAACRALGVDMMTGHWEFTYGMERVREIIDHELAPIEFLAQNIYLTDDAAFDGRPAFNEETGLVFKPYAMREVNAVRVAVIGQAFPYTTLANPRYLMDEWSFGIREEQVQASVVAARTEGAEVVVLLSHNGMDVDLKLASRVRGIDVILGGHTHDGMPAPSIVSNTGGKTLVINSGSNGKFLSVVDLDVRSGQLQDFQFRLLPVFSNLLAPDADMVKLIEDQRAPYTARLAEELATTDTLLYRRGNFSGPFDQLIVDALMAVRGADIAFSPGFRWGTTLLPGDVITMERLLDQTAITYAKVTLSDMTGASIHALLEDIADNLFNPDPYYQMGGDMVRIGGLSYTIDPAAPMGQRISELHFKGKPISLNRRYRVAGWASVLPQSEALPDIWEVVGEYLRDKKLIGRLAVNMPHVKGIKANPGFSGSKDQKD
ncbi:MAG: thiosulfohydrolase SoxB [Pseudomonadota bacterium]|nr:thiosulfohydrolase SoxB [Pseudomonadota bacterium]